MLRHQPARQALCSTTGRLISQSQASLCRYSLEEAYVWLFCSTRICFSFYSTLLLDSPTIAGRSHVLPLCILAIRRSNSLYPRRVAPQQVGLITSWVGLNLFNSLRSTPLLIFTWRERSELTAFTQINFVADCLFKWSAILEGKRPFYVFEPPFGGLGVKYDVHLGLIGKRVPDYC